MSREEKLPPGVYRRKDSKFLWIHEGYRGRDLPRVGRNRNLETRCGAGDCRVAAEGTGRRRDGVTVVA